MNNKSKITEHSIFYKVITHRRRSIVMHKDSIGVTYHKQKWVKPSMKYSYLAVFNNMKAALKFTENMTPGKFMIVPCLIKGARVKNLSFPLCDTKEFSKFWKNFYNNIPLPQYGCRIWTGIPKGTVFAREVWCIE